MPDRLGWSDVTYPADARNPEGIRVRVRVNDLGDGIRFAVGDDLLLIRDINRAIIGAFGWLLLVFFPLSLAGGLFLSRGFLRRVDAIRQTAEAIIAGDLAQRIPARGTDDDLDRLSNTLNRMLDRIAALIESLSQVSNDIAHDLRTPLTRLRNKLVAAQSLVSMSPAQKASFESMIAETDEILDTFSALLRIAQIEAGTRRAGFQSVDLSETVANVAHAFSAAAEAEGKLLISDIQPGLTIHGDRELLTQMLANLVENAVRHTPIGSRIEIMFARKATGVVGSVADSGPGVPADERKRIFRRMYRLERSRTTPGSGLGLAVVAAIANLHGIELVVGDHSPGLIITMRF
jgi:signal transduction histidine kinase